ncbi:40950_t:CDS:2, partial [Gigaspora margarita]
HLNAKNQKEQLTAENDYLKEELESLAADYISYFYEHANKVLNDKNALIQEYAYNFKKQNNVIISLKQTCNYLLAELNKKNLATSETSNNLDKKTLRK